MDGAAAAAAEGGSACRLRHGCRSAPTLKSLDADQAARGVATASRQLSKREQSLCNGVSPWLSPLAMVLTQDLALKGFFGHVRVIGAEHLPKSGAVLMAPTHRARWDALLLPYAAGRRVTGRDCRFMVTLDEMKGLQGWFLHRLGCFPVNQLKPQTASLRYAVDLLEAGQQLVVFPEGRIMREPGPIRLMQGLSRLALLASAHGLSVPVLPIGIAYGRATPRFGDAAALAFGPPLTVTGHGREAARRFSDQLAAAMAAAERQALEAVGRSATEGGFATPVEFSNV